MAKKILKITPKPTDVGYVVNCHTFKDFNFNVLAPLINKRSENFIDF